MTSVLPEEIIKKIDAIRLKFPPERSQSAVIMALRVLQDHWGFLTRPHMEALAELLAIPVVAVMEVAHFYSLYRHKKRGRVCVKVCQGLPCALQGSHGLLQALEASLGIACGETSGDSEWTLLTTECQAACVQAPVVLTNDREIDRIANPSELAAWKSKWTDTFTLESS